MSFIPAKESPLLIKAFRIYTRFLFFRHFKRIWIKQEYEPRSSCKTVYFLNHHSWWDGLIPLLLNEYRFHQPARALMEEKQMRRYPFFKYLGAFSINREQPAQAMESLRYAEQSMRRPHSALFIYPEGKITPADSKPEFEGGLAWLHDRLPNVDFVPVGIYIHTLRSPRPELHLHVGRPVRLDTGWDRREKTRAFERRMRELLEDLHSHAGFDDTVYERWR